MAALLRFENTKDLQLQKKFFFQCGKIYQSLHTSKPRCIFLQSKTTGVFSLSRFYYRRKISLKILKTKLLNRLDQGQVWHYIMKTKNLMKK